MLEVFRKLGSIQFDPLAVAGRTHDLVLHARVAGYEPGWCEALYERREIFEAYNKGLSLVPTSEFPWFRGTLGRSSRQLLVENAEVAERVLERIRAEGPLSSLDFERQSGATTDWFGMPTNTVRAVLEALGGHRRARPRAARRQPPVLRPPRTAAAGRRARARSAAARADPAQAPVPLPGPRSARRQRGADIFGGLGSAKPDPRLPGYPGRSALREELVERGELVPVEVEGVRGKRFVIAEDVELLEAPPEPPPSVAFLPPFDALVWDRDLLGSLFDFDYVWELFFPPAKRRWGWYVLPITFRDRFVGRIEPRIDRADARVQVLGRLVGGRLRAEPRPRGSSTRCATRCAPTCASQAQATSSGHPTSERRNGSSSLARDPYC